MTGPPFQEPGETPHTTSSASEGDADQPEFSTDRHWGRGRQRPPEQLAARLRYLEKIGRRCDGSNRECDSAATSTLTVVELNEDRQPEGEPYQVQSCSGHKSLWVKRPDLYRVDLIEPLPPRTDHVQMRNPHDKRRPAPPSSEVAPS